MRIGRFLLNDDRVLAAVRFVDAVSGLPIRDAVDVAGARSSRNRSMRKVQRGLFDTVNRRFATRPWRDAGKGTRVQRPFSRPKAAYGKAGRPSPIQP